MPNKAAVDALVAQLGLAGTPGAASATLTGTVSAGVLDQVIQANKAVGGTCNLVAGVFTLTYQQ